MLNKKQLIIAFFEIQVLALRFVREVCYTHEKRKQNFLLLKCYYNQILDIPIVLPFPTQSTQ